MRTLRSQLILSHILPLIVIIIVIGFTLNYVLETRFLLTNLAGKLTGQAVLAAELSADFPEIWTDPAQAQQFVDRIGGQLGNNVMLIDTQAILLASNNPADADQLGQPAANLNDLEQVLAGEVFVHTDFNAYLDAEIVDVMVPAWSADQTVLGAIRLTQPLENISDEFLSLRWLLFGVLAFGLLLGIGIAWLLALNLGSNLRQVTQAVHQLGSGQTQAPLPESGPEELRSLLQTANTLATRLQIAEQNRRQLLANLVHELSRPLGALLSATQALRGGGSQDPDFFAEVTEGMQEEIKRLGRLVEDLALLHNQIVGSLELRPAPIALLDWLLQTISPWKQAAIQKGLSWETDLPDELPTLQVDPDRLGQALGNLLSNAIKYTKAPGQVVVSAGLDREWVWVQVRDSGPGIDAHDQAHIFQPLYRGPAKRRFPQGMGLGLNIAKNLVEAHGGNLDMESSPEKGSTFTIHLPASLRSP